MQPRLLVTLLGLGLSLGACRFGGPPDGGELSARLADRIQQRGGETIDLAELTPFEWTRFCAFHPYTTQEMAEADLGFAWPHAWTIDDDDGHTYLVFLDGDTVAAAFEHPRNEGDFAGLGPACYSHSDARFGVRTVDGPRGRFVVGQPVLEPRFAP